MNFNTLILKTHSPENIELYQLSLMNHIKYAEKHRYDVLSIDINYNKICDEYIGYIKYGFEKYDSILTIGSDILFTNFEKSLDSFKDSNYGVILSLEELGGSFCNFDLVLWQNNQKSYDILNRIIELTPIWIEHPWTLQQAFNIMAKESIGKSHIKYLPCRQFQSSPFNYAPNYKWQKEDFSLHYLCMNNKEKYDGVKYFLDNNVPLYR